MKSRSNVKAIEIILILFGAIILSYTFLESFKLESTFRHFLKSRWETIATILIFLGFLNSISVILYVILNLNKKSNSKDLDKEIKILELTLKRDLLLKNLRNKNEDS